MASKSLALLASGEIEGKEHHALRAKLLAAAAERAEREIRREGKDARSVYAREDAERRAIFAASEAGEEAQKVRRAREIRQIEDAARAARPAPGTYKHELALMRGRGRPPGAHDAHDAREPSEPAHDVLTTKTRYALPDRAFALPERRELPVHDAAHVRAAASRLEQMMRRGTVTKSEYARAKRRILRAEAELGIGRYRR